MCICGFACTSMCVYVHLYMRACLYVLRVHVYMCVYMRVWVHMCGCVHLSAHVCIHVSMCTDMCVYLWTCVHMCIYVHLSIYVGQQLVARVFFRHPFWGIPPWPLGSYSSFSLTDPCHQPVFAKINSLTLCYSDTRFAFSSPTLKPLVPLCFPKHRVWFVASHAAPRSCIHDFVLY